MILAAAQTNPKVGNISANLDDHYKFIEKASEFGTNLIVFPEMSITGYSTENVCNMSFVMNDSRLDGLQKYANKFGMTLVAGAPIKIGGHFYIASFIISPEKQMLIYTKQYLHTAEEGFFKSSFSYNPQLKIEEEAISFAICADIENPKHLADARKSKATLYIPSIFFSVKGIYLAQINLSNYAKIFSLNILVSNFCGQINGVNAGGKSAFWNKQGEKIGELDIYKQGLLVIEKNGNDFILKGLHNYN